MLFPCLTLTHLDDYNLAHILVCIQLLFRNIGLKLLMKSGRSLFNVKENYNLLFSESIVTFQLNIAN